MAWRFCSLWLLAGCAPVTAIGDKIIGLTHPVLAGGMVTHVEPPGDPALAALLEGTGLESDTTARFVLADALELRDIEAAQILDAELTVDGTPFVTDEAGWYGPAAMLPPYEVGARWSLEVQLTDRVLPAIVQFDLPAPVSTPGGTALEPGESFQIALDPPVDVGFATVFDAEGNTVWTDAPTESSDIVDLVLPLREPVSSIAVPSEAFEAQDVYVVAIAALDRAPPDRIDGLNEALTAVHAGAISLEPVVVGPRLALQAFYIGAEPVSPATAVLLDDAGVSVEASASLLVGDLARLQAGVADAQVTVDGTPATPGDEGFFTVDGLDYEVGDEPLLRANTDLAFEPAVFQPVLPAASPFEVPPISVGQAVQITLPDGPWSAALVTVIGPDGVTYDNTPEGRSEWASLAPADIDDVAIPGSAFTAPGPHVIGIAALEAQPDALSGAHPRYSHGLAGAFRFVDVQVQP